MLFFSLSCFLSLSFVLHSFCSLCCFESPLFLLSISSSSLLLAVVLFVFHLLPLLLFSAFQSRSASLGEHGWWCATGVSKDIKFDYYYEHDTPAQASREDRKKRKTERNADDDREEKEERRMREERDKLWRGKLLFFVSFSF